MAAVAAAALVMSHAGASAFRQEVRTHVFENERVVIWKLRPDAPERSVVRARFPGVLVSLADGVVRLTNDTGTATSREAAVLIELKDFRVAPLTTPRGVARAFPREGAQRVLENDRILVWDLTWTTGMKTTTHFHDKDVVVVYLGGGTVRSIPLTGEPTATRRSAGEAVFLPRGRTHIEECIEGPRRDIVIELK